MSSNDSSIIPPEAGEGYKSRYHATLYVQEHANLHGFRVSIFDSRKSFVKFKCFYGEYWGDKNKTPSTSNEKTCLFRCTARRDPSNHRCWNLTVQHPEHNHAPDFDGPKHDLAVIRKKIETHEKELQKQKENIPQPVSSNINLTNTSDLPQAITFQYQALHDQMLRLPIESQAFLLTRFLSECQLAQGLASTLTSSSTIPSKKSRKRIVKKSQDQDVSDSGDEDSDYQPKVSSV